MEKASAFECSVCFEEFGETEAVPLLLECGHTFCDSCITALPSPKCPTCRAVTTRAKTPKNYALLELIACKKEEQKRRCQHHKDEARKIYCTDCQLAICLICKEYGSHVGHRTKPVQQAVREKREKMAEECKQLKSMEERARSEVRRLAEELKERRELMGEWAKRAQAEFESEVKAAEQKYQEELKRLQNERSLAVERSNLKLATTLEQLVDSTQRKTDSLLGERQKHVSLISVLDSAHQEREALIDEDELSFLEKEISVTPLSQIQPKASQREALLSEGDADLKIFQLVQDILSEPEDQKLDLLTSKVTNVRVSDKILQRIVMLVLEAVVVLPKFCDIYAELCAKMCPCSSIQRSFKKSLLSACQLMFEELVHKEDKGKELIGCITFLCQLFHVGCLTESIMCDCITKLLTDSCDTDLEAVCVLMISIGPSIDENPQKLQFFMECFVSMEEYARRPSTPSRIQVMLLNTIKKRRPQWRPKGKS